MKKNLAVLFLFVILTVVVTWPLILNLNSWTTDEYDALLITWIINWGIHSFSSGFSGLANIYHANIFFPYKFTLAYSDLLFTESLVALPFVLFFKEPLLAFNINYFSGIILTGFALFLLARELTKKDLVSFFVAVLFTFSPLHLSYSGHLQLFNVWPVILAILFLLQSRQKLFILMFLLSALTTPLFFYFLLLVWVLMEKRSLKTLFIACFITVPLLIPYWLVSRQFSYQRPITDAIHFSLQFPNIINPSNTSRWFNILPTNSQTPAFFGGVFTFLVIWIIINFRQMWENKMGKRLLIIALVSFVFALGPALHLRSDTVHIGSFRAIPLPYAVFYYFVPGFSGFRAPSRWIILTALSLSLAVGITLAKKSRHKLLIVTLILFVLAEISWPLKYTAVPNVSQFPPEQIWLRDHYLGAPIIQFPIYNWSDAPQYKAEIFREYYSTVHWHPMFNGFSGFSPAEWQNQVFWLQKEFPSAETISYLKGKGIKLVLAPKDWKINLNKIVEFDKTVIYEIY